MVYWIDDPNGAAAPAAPPALQNLQTYFQEEDATNGIPKTAVRSWFLNMLLQEILNVVQWAGIAPLKTQNNQLLAALQSKLQGGRYIGRQIYTSSGSYTPTLGTGLIRIRMVGAGGGAGGAANNVGTASSASSPGGAGAEIEAITTVGNFSVPCPITIGSGGTGGFAAQNGSSGGATYFGNYNGPGSILAGGGSGGVYGNSIGAGSGAQFGQSFGGIVSYGNFTNGLVLKAKTGNIGPNAVVIPNGSASPINLPGIGPETEFGGGGGNANQGNGGNGQGYGSGGGGAGSQSGIAYSGGNGAPGYMIIEEYS